MNRHSILFKIILFFFIAFLAMTALFKVMYESEFASQQDKMRVHYHHIAMSIMRWRYGGGSQQEMMKALLKRKIKVVNEKSLYEKFWKSTPMDQVSCAKGDFRIYKENGIRYIITPKNVGDILLKDTISTPIEVNYVWWLYAAFVLILVALFISIAISLYPIKPLQRHIQRFGEGKLDESFDTRGKDEIAQVSREFNKAAQRIKGLIQGRAIFLRNITHELKTPITKGKLSLEFLEASRSKEILNNVFTRLDLLTREFLQIEKITACDYDIEKKPYQVSEVLNQALDLLFLEPESIENNLGSLKLDVDFELFAIVLKNLIDNGLKYSEDAQVTIEYDEGEIAVCSKGEPLEHELDFYMQPFNKCDINPENSFGLGLYLVDYILKKHRFGFDYRHKEGINKFIIIVETV